MSRQRFKYAKLNLTMASLAAMLICVHVMATSAATTAKPGRLKPAVKAVTTNKSRPRSATDKPQNQRLLTDRPHSNYSSIMMFGRKDEMSIQNGILKCGGVLCPRGTQACHVYQSTKRDKNIIDIQIKCTGDTEQVMNSRNISIPNLKGRELNEFSLTALNGSMWSCNRCEGNTPEDILRNMQRADDFNEEETMKKLQKELEEAGIGPLDDVMPLDDIDEAIAEPVRPKMKKRRKGKKQRRRRVGKRKADWEQKSIPDYIDVDRYRVSLMDKKPKIWLNDLIDIDELGSDRVDQKLMKWRMPKDFETNDNRIIDDQEENIVRTWQNPNKKRHIPQKFRTITRKPPVRSHQVPKHLQSPLNDWKIIKFRTKPGFLRSIKRQGALKVLHKEEDVPQIEKPITDRDERYLKRWQNIAMNRNEPMDDRTFGRPQKRRGVQKSRPNELHRKPIRSEQHHNSKRPYLMVHDRPQRIPQNTKFVVLESEEEFE